MSITFSLLAILLTIAVMLHVTEEFLFPGGFSEWYARLVPPRTSNKNTTGFLVWINTLMMCANAFALYFGDTLQGYSIWYYNAAIAAANACFHIWGVLKLKAYSPGVITGTLLYLPLFVIGSIYLVGSGVLPVRRAIVAVAVAVGYHIYSIIKQRR
jgi:hypothetical protein